MAIHDPGGHDRNANTPLRVRRELQLIQAQLENGTLLAITPNGGLVYTGDPKTLGVDVDPPIIVGPAGVGLAMAPGLSVVGGALAYDLPELATYTPTNPPNASDALLAYDAASAAHKRLLLSVIAGLAGSTGDIKATFASAAPTGWLLLNGDTIGNVGSGATHEAANLGPLFDIVKAFAPNTGAESFAGGDTVVLPNAQRRVLMGAGGAGTATIGNAIGDIGGEEDHTLTVGEMPVHDHDYLFPAAVVNRQAGAGNNLSATFSLIATTTATGNGQAHNNIQPSLVVNYLVRI